MDIRTDIWLNQLAQGIKPLDTGVDTFSGLSTDVQLEALRRLSFFIVQAGAVGRDAEAAVSQSGLKRTLTPCQLLLQVQNHEPNGSAMLKVALAKTTNLPVGERSSVFRLLIALLNIADKRKRARGLQPEKYWWHRDLSDDRVIEQVLSENRY